MAGLPRQGATAPAVTAATDKRFKRAHVKPSRKRTPASKHLWLAVRVIAMLMVIGYGGYRGVTSD